MAAIIVPDFEVVGKWAKEQGLQFSNNEELIELEDVNSIYKKDLRAFSKELASHEKIRDFRLVPIEFTVETGEITPTLKVKRSVIEDKYGDMISDIFSDDN